MGILGIYASQISGHLVTNSYESIATATPSGVTSFSFTSIPSTYKHLQIRYIGRDNRGGAIANSMIIRFNSDTGNNYSKHTIEAYSGAVYSYGQANSNSANYSVTSGGGAGANTFGAGIIDVLDYADVNKYKTVRSLSGVENNTTTSDFYFDSGNWRSTSAITSISFGVGGGSDLFQTGSQFALYGIKG